MRPSGLDGCKAAEPNEMRHQTHLGQHPVPHKMSQLAQLLQPASALDGRAVLPENGRGTG